MKLTYRAEAKDPTYYVQESYRNKFGKSTTHSVYRIGKHSELLRITDDPVQYAKDIVTKMNEEKASGHMVGTMEIDYDEELDESETGQSESTVMNVGYFYIQETLRWLELNKFFDNATKGTKIEYDAYTISRFMTYSRILDPASKLKFSKTGKAYFEEPDLKYHNILRFMDLLDDHSKEYIEWLYEKSKNIVKRDAAVIYYDCTNFYFETEKEDEDYVDEVTGEEIKGLRRYGVSKEHRPNPIVQMGLFMDRNGLPITMSVTPGNTSEKKTAIPLEEEVISMLKYSNDFIYCADSGLSSYDIRTFNSLGGRSYVVTQSVKMLTDVLKTAVFNDEGYRLLSNERCVKLSDMKTFDIFDPDNLSLYDDTAYKIIEASLTRDIGLRKKIVFSTGTERIVKDNATVKQDIIVTFSRKLMEYQRSVRDKQIDRAKNLLETRDPEEIKKGPNDVTRFLIRRKKDGTTDDDFRYEFNEDRVREEERYDGFYAVATNLKGNVKDILSIVHGRHKIEDCFRTMKMNFTGRPVNHRKPNRIRAHFLICYTALLTLRIMERRLDENGTHLTTDTLIKALKDMNVAPVDSVNYKTLYKNCNELRALSSLGSLTINKRMYLEPVLCGKIREILKKNSEGKK